MATWIAHLRIAENLLASIPAPSTSSPGERWDFAGQRLDAARFAIGSLAPDAGIPDEKWEHFNPPPQVTHFKRSDSVHKDIADLDFYRKYLADVSPLESERYTFRLGYFFHLITDNLWTIAVGKPTEERYPDQFAADKNFIWEVKKDWYGLDHIYVREHPDCLFWRVLLDARPDSAELDFLPPEALPRQLGYIKAFYQRRDENIDELCARPFIYLSKGEMDSFVEESSDRLQRIYNCLWPNPPVLDGLYSALELRV